eukprot:TRINITY_DN20776_c0_g1_i1.p1 TRINITY_DN20776_c0_g1~~TRINITY_DN20776_c0_g1_i1.p1  ORF type:complete len:337 (+),score=118.11 TRINITY_DN20776_c0_g1_i1:44-1054(+)
MEPRKSMVNFDSSDAALEQWTTAMRNKRPVSMATTDMLRNIHSPEDAKRAAERIMASKRSQGDVTKTAEQILAELQMQEEEEARMQDKASSDSGYVHQVHSIPVRAGPPPGQRQQPPPQYHNEYLPYGQTIPVLSKLDSRHVPSQPGRKQPWPRDPMIDQAAGIGEAVADEDFNENVARNRALHLLKEYKEFRQQAEQREDRYEAELIDAKMAIAELEGRVGELTKQLREERMRSDAILREDDAATQNRDKNYLRTKLKEVVAVHEVLQWQMHEKEKELRTLEDIIKAHLLIHAGPAKPLRLLLARRLPQFLQRCEQGIPIIHDARQEMAREHREQ